MRLPGIEVKAQFIGPNTDQSNDVYFPYMDNLRRVRYRTAVLLLTLLAVWTGCAPPPPRDTHDADVRSITEGEALWVRHWSTRDAERIVAHYADDAMVMAPNWPRRSAARRSAKW